MYTYKQKQKAMKVLRNNDGNVSKTSRQLKISPITLTRWQAAERAAERINSSHQVLSPQGKDMITVLDNVDSALTQATVRIKDLEHELNQVYAIIGRQSLSRSLLRDVVNKTE